MQNMTAESINALPKKTNNLPEWKNLFTDSGYPETLADLLSILERVKANVAAEGVEASDVHFSLWRDDVAALDIKFSVDRREDEDPTGPPFLSFTIGMQS